MAVQSATRSARLRRKPPEDSRNYAAILDSAEAIFGAQGFRKAGIGEIAAQAQVSKPLIYRYFRSKKHLFEVVVDRVISEWTDVVTSAGERVTPGAAHSIRLIVRASLDFARSRDVLRGLLARESQLMLSGYSDVLERVTAILRNVLREALGRGVRDGDVRSDIDLESMADVVTEVCVGFGDRLLSGNVGGRENELLDAIIETVLFGVIAPRRSAANG